LRERERERERERGDRRGCSNSRHAYCLEREREREAIVGDVNSSL
jgi:hypothetical protein